MQRLALMQSCHCTLLIWVILAAALVPSLRAEDTPPVPPTAPAAPRILDGTLHPSSDFPTVALLTDAAGTFLCSGTLISPRHILTAGHCGVDGDGNKLPDDGGRALIGGAVQKTSRVILHPSFNLGLLGDPSIVDAAIYELDTPLVIAPSPIARSAPAVGQTVTLVGFGKLGSGKKGIQDLFPPQGQVSSGTTMISEVGNSTLSWIFQPGESATAPGDSGGPAFIDTAVAGIHSLAIASSEKQLGRFGSMNQDTRVDAIAAWIDKVTTGSSSNNPPLITTAATASPSTLNAGGTVTFSVAASDPEGDNLLYIWDFGDGNAKIGPTQGHIYSFPGVYNASVSISDGINGLNFPTPVTVNATSNNPLTLKKLQLSLNFLRSSSDSFSLSGTLSPVPPFQPLGSFVKVDIGGAQTIFALDPKGRDREADGSISINAKTGAITVSGRFGDFSQKWADEGLINADTSTTVNMPVTIAVDGNVYSTTKTLQYMARANKSGKAH